MTATCLIASPADDAATPDPDRSDSPERPGPPPLAEVLDVQVAEVPGTAGAFEHFFSDV